MLEFEAKMNDIKQVIKHGAYGDLESVNHNQGVLFENRIEVMIALNHHVFNEKEAAFYCRCSVDSIRYHALRSRKLTFCDFTKDGLVFVKTDLDTFLLGTRKQGYRG